MFNACASSSCVSIDRDSIRGPALAIEFASMANRNLHFFLVVLLSLWTSLQAHAQGLSTNSLTAQREGTSSTSDGVLSKRQGLDRTRLNAGAEDSKNLGRQDRHRRDSTDRLFDRPQGQQRSTNLRMGGTSGTSGGGDRFTTDFAKIAEQEIYLWLKIHGGKLTPAVDAGTFRIANDPEAMVSVDHVFESCHFILVNEGQKDQTLQAIPQNLPGHPDPEREACYNDDTQLIYISRTRYPLTMQNSAPKRGLIAHEIFRKMGIEGDEHQISKQISILSVPVSGPNTYVHDTNACNTTKQAMSNLISSYVDALKICYGLEQSNQAHTALYRTEATIARQIESSFANAAFYCNRVCDDASTCNLTTPEGICRQ